MYSSEGYSHIVLAWLGMILPEPYDFERVKQSYAVHVSLGKRASLSIVSNHREATMSGYGQRRGFTVIPYGRSVVNK